MANSIGALQFLLLSAVCLNMAFSYKLVQYDPFSLTGLMLQSQHLVAEPQTLVRMAKAIDGSLQTPVYKDTAPIMPRHMEYVDLKAYESAVRDLITEVDKKDRAPRPISDDLDPRPSRHVDVNVNVNPYVDVKVKKHGNPDGGVNEDDNGGTIDAEGGVVVDGGHGIVVKPFKPLNLGIDIPGIFNLQIFRDHNGRRRIGIGVLPGWTGIHVGHATNNPGTQVGVQVGAPKNPGTQVGVEVGAPKHPGTQVGVEVGAPKHPGTQVGVQVGAPNNPGPQVGVQVGAPSLHVFHYYK